LHTYHIHHNLLEAINKAIHNSVTLSIKLLEVKAHTGSFGNERTDQIAKHVAKHPEAADTSIKMVGHKLHLQGNPLHNITWLATSTEGPNTQCPNAGNGNQPQPNQLHMRYLPQQTGCATSTHA